MKTNILLVLALLSLILAVPAARIYATSSSINYNGSSDPTASVAFPSSTDTLYVTAYGGAGADIITFSLSTTTAVDIFVGDGYVTGDQYYVSLDGVHIFTTDAVAFGSTSTGLDGCTGSADVAAGLSWGDVTVTLPSGTHTINVTDIANPDLWNPSAGPQYSAGFCLVLSPPPSFSTPQFPLGLPLLLAVTMVGLVIVRKSVLPNAKRAV